MNKSYSLKFSVFYSFVSSESGYFFFLNLLGLLDQLSDLSNGLSLELVDNLLDLGKLGKSLIDSSLEFSVEVLLSVLDLLQLGIHNLGSSGSDVCLVGLVRVNLGLDSCVQSLLDSSASGLDFLDFSVDGSVDEVNESISLCSIFLELGINNSLDLSLVDIFVGLEFVESLFEMSVNGVDFLLQFLLEFISDLSNFVGKINSLLLHGNSLRSRTGIQISV